MNVSLIINQPDSTVDLITNSSSELFIFEGSNNASTLVENVKKFYGVMYPQYPVVGFVIDKDYDKALTEDVGDIFESYLETCRRAAKRTLREARTDTFVQNNLSNSYHYRIHNYLDYTLSEDGSEFDTDDITKLYEYTEAHGLVLAPEVHQFNVRDNYRHYDKLKGITDEEMRSYEKFHRIRTIFEGLAYQVLYQRFGDDIFSKASKMSRTESDDEIANFVQTHLRREFLRYAETIKEGDIMLTIDEGASSAMVRDLLDNQIKLEWMDG